MKKQITIVSGQPRSGTSMMMRMLRAGGLELFHTTPEKGNEFNPDGYFETSFLQGMNVWHGWIAKVDGKAMKVLTEQLKNLPKEYYGEIDYKIIFMQRNPVESAKSMAKMQGSVLSKNEKQITDDYDKLIDEVKQLVEKSSNMEIMFWSYDDALNIPNETGHSINDFLGTKLDVKKMIAIPDKKQKHF